MDLRRLAGRALTLDDVELREGAVITIDSYRALAAAAWDSSSDLDVVCPTVTVVANDDPSGVFEALEEETVEAPVSIAEQTAEGEEALYFLPGE